MRIRGSEYQLRWRPFENTRLIYSHALVYIDADYTDSSIVADDINNVPKILNQTRDSAPTHSQSAMLIQKLPYDFLASVMYFCASPMRWRRNSDPIQASERFDWHLGKEFKLGPARGEVAYTVQMANEQQEGRQPFRVANQLHWLTLRVNY